MPTIERASRLPKSALPNINLLANEFYSIREFQSRAFNYLDRTPEMTDHLGWLSYIQHYGGTTRLLDFTESFYVAVYFAFDSYFDFQDSKSVASPTIWCINARMLKDAIPHDIRDKYISDGLGYPEDVDYQEMFNHFFQDGITNQVTTDVCGVAVSGLSRTGSQPNEVAPLVIPIKPKTMHQRLHNQKGLFLTQIDHTYGFVSTINQTFARVDHDIKMPSTDQEPAIYSSRIIELTLNNSFEFYRDVQIQLNEMGINPESMFPGLEGLARSTRHVFNTTK
jgi:hypothetical protein